ncbi:hypothetical protein R6Q59_029844 [Mikania micrantha]
MLIEGSRSEAFDGIGISSLLTSNPAIQVGTHLHAPGAPKNHHLFRQDFTERVHDWPRKLGHTFIMIVSSLCCN